ncbi:hypothetical protein BDB00DRAFT_931221 [Zychaea mexicana]|uniref:uncharacterized protein n=1 Tax=Zychaea mexicana TaxID=64656 RepID=UPI0022FEAD69|nr:uncharacterized protein BDB00DRAFT_931221 [Zychaea mexicana]KAI9490422.1 hypothetical protein BDB00DRAFT_931221 [Zychaea mexicana]
MTVTDTPKMQIGISSNWCIHSIRTSNNRTTTKSSNVVIDYERRVYQRYADGQEHLYHRMVTFSPITARLIHYYEIFYYYHIECWHLFVTELAFIVYQEPVPHHQDQMRRYPFRYDDGYLPPFLIWLQIQVRFDLLTATIGNDYAENLRKISFRRILAQLYNIDPDQGLADQLLDLELTNSDATISDNQTCRYKITL